MPNINWNDDIAVDEYLTQCLLAANEPERLTVMPVTLSKKYDKWERAFLANPFKYAKRATRSFANRALRAAVAAILIVTVSFGTLLAVNPEARAAVVNWFIERFGTHDTYRSTGEQTDSATAEWHAAYLPDGYVEVTRTDLFGYVKVTFERDNEAQLSDAITLIYQPMVEGTTMGQDNEQMEVQQMMIDNTTYIIYQSLISDKPNSIIWNDYETNTMFALISPLQCDTLLEIATQIKQK